MKDKFYIVSVMDKIIKFNELETALIFAKKFIKDDEMLVEVYELDDETILTRGCIDNWCLIAYNSFYDYDMSIDALVERASELNAENSEFFSL